MAPPAGIECRTKAKVIDDKVYMSVLSNGNLRKLDVRTRYTIKGPALPGGFDTLRDEGVDTVIAEDVPNGTYTAEANLDGYGNCAATKPFVVHAGDS